MTPLAALRCHSCAVKILVVEDEFGIAEALRRGLTADGFVVDVADNGTDGLDMATASSYGAIILDIMLRGLNGYRVCRELRSNDVWTPIIMLTAKDGEFDEMEGLDLGADDYITKPFSYPVLLSRLRAILRRAGAGQPTSDILTDPNIVEVYVSRIRMAIESPSHTVSIQTVRGVGYRLLAERG